MSKKTTKDPWKQRKSYKFSELEKMSSEEVENLMNSISTDEESGSDNDDDMEASDPYGSDDSAADPNYDPSQSEDEELNQCVSHLVRANSNEFLNDINWNMDNISEPTARSSPQPSTSSGMPPQPSTSSGMPSQPSTSSGMPPQPSTSSNLLLPSTGEVVRSTVKPQKRPRSPLPILDPEGRQFEPNTGGFVGKIVDINPKSDEFRKIIWRKKHLQLHINEVVFVGDTSLPPEIQSLETPADVFRFFITDEFVDKIAEFTNLNARTKNINTNFKVTGAEIKQFIGILIFMSLYRAPTAMHYWGRYSFLPIAKTMPVNKFKSIRQYLCFNDFSQMKRKGEAGYDTLFKVRPIIDHLNKRYDMVPKLGRLCVDEQMCPTKMKSKLRQYMPKKPHKWGKKLYVLCDSTGYSYRFEVYAGAGDNVVAENCPNLGATGNVVARLSATIPHMKNHILFFDNFYTSIPLLVMLRSRGIYSLGTVKRDRLPNCKLSLGKKAKRGESVEYVGTAYGVQISTVQWMDTKLVHLASTYVGTKPFISSNQPQDGAKAIRYDRQKKRYLEVDCPQIIREYNAHMGGVDLMDGLLGRYKIRLKTRSYSHRLFYHFLDVTLVNSYLLHRRIHGKTLQLPDFRTNVAEVLCRCGLPVEKRSVGRPSKSVVVEHGGSKKTYLPVPDIRFDRVDHFPQFLTKKVEKRLAKCQNGSLRLKCIVKNVA